MQIFFIKLSADVKFFIKLIRNKISLQHNQVFQHQANHFLRLESQKKTLVVSVSNVSLVNKLFSSNLTGGQEKWRVSLSIFQAKFLLISLTHVK